MNEQDRINLYWFLGLTFFIGWGLQFGGMYLLHSQIFRGMYLLSLTAPMIAVFLMFNGRIGTETSGIGWGMKMRDKWMYLLVAWLAPAAFALAGTALYFLVFPGRFDPNLGALKELVLHSGLAWAVWYMPLIIMAGFQYGHNYPGAPATGIVMMAVYCIAGGTLLSWLYEKSGSILMAGIAHGAMMSAGSFGLYFLAHAPEHYLLGPGTGGVISVIPMAVCAFFLMKKDKPDAKPRRRR